MDYRIPDHDSILDSIDRRTQEWQPDGSDVEESDDEDTWEDDRGMDETEARASLQTDLDEEAKEDGNE